MIGHSNVITVADFEYVSPRIPEPLFIPLRLYLPYGYWTEPDGAQVLFSRDYKSLWRLRQDAEPERLEPWVWINVQDEKWLWKEGQAPWDHPSVRSELESFLDRAGVRTLPILVDALPLLVRNTKIGRFSEAAAALQAARAMQ